MLVNWYLVDLTCNHCGALHARELSNPLSNKVCQDGYTTGIEKGQSIDIDLDDISSEYFRINEPTTNQVKCAELWGCDNCGRYNFAELLYLIRPHDTIMEDIKEVVLTPEYFDTLNFLSENIDDWAEKFTEPPVFPSHHSNRLLQPTPEEIKNFREFLVRLQEEKKR